MIRLETTRLILRDHELGDLESYIAIESDPEYRGPQVVHPRAELERSFRESMMVPKPRGLWATEVRATGRYIGRCGLHPCRDDNDQVIPGEACLAFYLTRPYWGRGLATEAGHAFVRLGFEVLGLTRIEAGINARNLASIRVIEKLGFNWVRSGEGGGSQWHLYELRELPVTLK